MIQSLKRLGNNARDAFVDQIAAVVNRRTSTDHGAAFSHYRIVPAEYTIDHGANFVDLGKQGPFGVHTLVFGVSVTAAVDVPVLRMRVLWFVEPTSTPVRAAYAR